MDIEFRYADGRAAPVLINWDSQEIDYPVLRSDALGYVVDTTAKRGTTFHATVNVQIDHATNEGTATVSIGDDADTTTLQVRIDPPITVGATVRVASYAEEHPGSWGTLVDVDPTGDVWEVELHEGILAWYERAELADHSDATIINGQPGLPNTENVETPPRFRIGDYAIYEDSPIGPGRLVQIQGRRYRTPLPTDQCGDPWIYDCADVAVGVTALSIGESALRAAPRNLVNLTIHPFVS